MRLAGLPERLSCGVEGAIDAGVGHGPEARRAVRHHHAHRAAAVALDADAVRADARTAAVEGRGDHLEQLVLVDRAAVELEVDADVRADRGRRRERADVVGRGVDDRGEALDVGEVAQCLDTAGSRARADRDQRTRLPADLLDALRLVERCDRALDERHVVGPPTVALLASRKYAISSSPASMSSSSSQSSTVSWQPSQEENFHTARLGITAPGSRAMARARPSG